MRLHYCEQKVNNQYRMEDICISYVEKKLMKTLPKEIWDEEMEVHFIFEKSGSVRILFVGKNYSLLIWGKYKEKIKNILLKSEKAK